MQIHRFDSAASPRPTSTGVRQGNGTSRSRQAGDEARISEAGGSVNSSELESLVSQLADVSEVRADVVAESLVRRVRRVHRYFPL